MPFLLHKQQRLSTEWRELTRTTGIKLNAEKCHLSCCFIEL